MFNLVDFVDRTVDFVPSVYEAETEQVRSKLLSKNTEWPPLSPITTAVCRIHNIML